MEKCRIDKYMKPYSIKKSLVQYVHIYVDYNTKNVEQLDLDDTERMRQNYLVLS